jgi:hypothetical protein
LAPNEKGDTERRLTEQHQDGLNGRHDDSRDAEHDHHAGGCARHAEDGHKLCGEVAGAHIGVGAIA